MTHAQITAYIEALEKRVLENNQAHDADPYNADALFENRGLYYAANLAKQMLVADGVREQIACPAGCDDGVDWSSGHAETCQECEGSGSFYVTRNDASGVMGGSAERPDVVRPAPATSKAEINEEAFQKAMSMNKGATYSDSETAFREFLEWYESAKVAPATPKAETVIHHKARADSACPSVFSGPKAEMDKWNPDAVLARLPVEGKRTKEQEWEACYAMLFNQLRAVTEKARQPIKADVEKCAAALDETLGLTGLDKDEVPECVLDFISYEYLRESLARAVIAAIPGVEV